jgi:hypothetical protein
VSEPEEKATEVVQYDLKFDNILSSMGLSELDMDGLDLEEECKE